jgi:hypothetical protein
MKNGTTGISRRHFLTNATLAAAGLAVGRTVALPSILTGTPAGPRSRAVLVRNPAAFTKAGEIDTPVVMQMIDEGVAALLQTPTADAAWKMLFTAGDKAGIKTNVYNYLPTPPAVADGLRLRLAVCGLNPDEVPVTDRDARTKLADRTALLNIRPVRTHHWSGIGSCLKNYIMFADTPSDWHEDSCADLGGIWHLPIVKGKTRLNILLALNPYFYGRGPHNFDARFQWKYSGLFMSTDPVAVDALGAELLRRKRVAFFGEDRIVTPTKHIEVAEKKHALGVADLKRIDLVRLGWKEDTLLD